MSRGFGISKSNNWTFELVVGDTDVFDLCHETKSTERLRQSPSEIIAAVIDVFEGRDKANQWRNGTTNEVLANVQCCHAKISWIDTSSKKISLLRNLCGYCSGQEIVGESDRLTPSKEGGKGGDRAAEKTVVEERFKCEEGK